MSEQRAQRVAEEIKREVSSILRTDIKDPRLADLSLISVTDVTVSRDIRHAKVFVSVFGDEEQNEKALQALSRAKGFIRSEVGRRIRLRHTPELTFELDSSMAYGAHINRLLNELNKSGGEKSGE